MTNTFNIKMLSFHVFVHGIYLTQDVITFNAGPHVGIYLSIVWVFTETLNHVMSPIKMMFLLFLSSEGSITANARHS